MKPLGVDVAREFPTAARGHYLDTATMSLGNRRATEAVQRAAVEWAEGTFDWRRGEEAGERCRQLIARLLGSDAGQVALVNAASAAAGLIAAQLASDGAGLNVVVPAEEFTSNFFPWRQLADHGYEVRLVEAPDGRLSVDRFAELIDTGTRLVATSLVQSSTGYRVDLPALADLTHRAGGRLVVDASQCLGAVVVDVAEGCDALFACDQKFLLGARGMGYLWVAGDWLPEFRPFSPGWKAAAEPQASFYGPAMELSPTASRLDQSLSWMIMLANAEGLAILDEAGREALDAHTAALAARLDDALAGRGLVAAPTGAGVSPIRSITVEGPADAAGSLSSRLDTAGVKVAGRAGRLRASLHLYNTADDVDALVDALAPAG